MPKRKTRRDQDGIFARPDSPFWWVSIPDGSGGSARRSTGVRQDEDPRRERAKVVRARLIAEAAEQRPQAPEPAKSAYTFDQLMLLYLKGPSKKKRSAERDLMSAKHLVPYFGSRELAALRRTDAYQYVMRRTDEGASAGTVNRELGLASSAVNWARKALDWDVPNPFLGSRQKEPEGRVRWLTTAEAESLVRAAQRDPRAPHLVDFILLGLYTGMRTGEMLGLEWKRVDLQAGLIYLEASHQKNQRRGSVPLNQDAREAILSRAQFRAQFCPGSPWVFCDKRGRRIQAVKRSFGTACKRAGIEDFHIHDLRHTCAAWLVQAGVPLTEIRDLLRHSTIQMTERYAHLAPENVRDAVDAIRGKVSRSGFTLVKLPRAGVQGGSVT